MLENMEQKTLHLSLKILKYMISKPPVGVAKLDVFGAFKYSLLEKPLSR